MNLEDRFESIINKFACAVKQCNEIGLALSIPRARGASPWNIVMSPGTKIYSLASKEFGTQTNPFAIILCGTKRPASIFGAHTDPAYNTNHYPYMSIERLFCMETGTFNSAFTEGYVNQPGNRNLYINDYGEFSSRAYAFDTGRYLLHKYHGTHLPYREFSFFK